VNAASRGGVWVRSTDGNPAEGRSGEDRALRAGMTNWREGNDVTSWGSTSALERARHGRSILAPIFVPTPDTLTVHPVVSTGLHASGCAFARQLFNREAQQQHCFRALSARPTCSESIMSSSTRTIVRLMPRVNRGDN